MTSESSGISRPAAPAWVDHVIWWQVYPLGATGAPIRPEPGEPLTEPGAPARLDSLEPWLDYAVELGANGLSLGPLFASSTHGYDTTDHLRIDPRLGDDAAFDRLAEACRSRGLSWACPDCGATNTGKFCSGCGRPKPAPAAPTGSWACPSCGSQNTGKFCSNCGTPQPQTEEAWFCPDCGAQNTGKFCSGCGHPRP